MGANHAMTEEDFACGVADVVALVVEHGGLYSELAALGFDPDGAHKFAEQVVEVLRGLSTPEAVEAGGTAFLLGMRVGVQMARRNLQDDEDA